MSKAEHIVAKIETAFDIYQQAKWSIGKRLYRYGYRNTEANREYAAFGFFMTFLDTLQDSPETIEVDLAYVEKGIQSFIDFGLSAIEDGLERRSKKELADQQS